MLTYHLDMANQNGVKLFKDVEKVSADFGMYTAFIVPEITEFCEEKLIRYIHSDELKKYKRIY